MKLYVYSLLFLLSVYSTHTRAVIGGNKVESHEEILQYTFGLASTTKTITQYTADGPKLIPQTELDAIKNAQLYSMGGCTATALSETILITAAHCVVDFDNSYYLAIPSYQLNAKYEKQISSKDIQPIFVDSVKIHSLYNKSNPQRWYDIALIYLRNKPSSEMKIMSWGHTTEDFLNTNIYAAGYGAILLQQSIYGYYMSHAQIQIDDLNYSEIEAEFGLNGTTTCYGDSGGPIYKINANGGLQILGIISRGKNFAKTCDASTIFTRIDKMQDWLQANY